MSDTIKRILAGLAALIVIGIVCSGAALVIAVRMAGQLPN